MLLRPRQILAPVIFATVFGYFGYHLVNGDRGLLAMAHLQRERHPRQLCQNHPRCHQQNVRLTTTQCKEANSPSALSTQRSLCLRIAEILLRMRMRR